MAVKLDEARIRLLKTNGTTTIAGGHVYLTGSSASSSTGNTTQLVFGTSSSNHVVLSSNDNALVINPTTSSTTNQIVLYLNQKAKFPSGIDAGTGGITTAGAISATGNISGNYIQGTWLYTSAATAQTTTSKIAVIHSDNYIYYITPANLTTLIQNNASGTWSISISGSAAKLTTPRAINGTNFDGSTAITTAHWGTARTLTIGNKGQSVNGSGNVSWSLHDILYSGTIGSTSSWDITNPGVYYVAPASNSTAYSGTGNPETNTLNNGTLYRWGQLIVSRANTGGLAQFYIAHQDSTEHNIYGIHFRTGWNGSYIGTWRVLLDSVNYTNWCDGRYVNTSGDTLTGALNFKNGTWNNVGDDAAMGDCNQAGMFGIKGLNGATGIYFTPYSGSTAQKISINGSGTMTITGTVASTFSGNLTGNATTATTASKLGSSTIGNTLTPIYLNQGTATVCETFGNRLYDYNNARTYFYSFGGSQDLNWKKVFAASHTATAPSSATYIGATIKGTIYYHKGNYNQAEVDEYPFQMNMGFLSNTSVSNSCTLRVAAGCPDTIIRAVRVSTNSFELQVRQPADWTKISIQFSYSGSASTMQAFSPVNSSNSSVIAFTTLTNSRSNYSNVAAKLGRGGDIANPMVFNWSGQSGQPSWLWGGNDGTNMYVYNPSNFNVNYAASAGSVAWGNITGKPSTYTPSSHTHSYLPLTGGSISGNVSFSAATSGTSPTAQRISINGVNNDSTVANAPGIGFHIGGLNWGSLKFQSDGSFRFYNDTCTGYKPIYGDKVYGAVWNDYAEYRWTTEEIQPGRCVVENGNDSLSLSRERMQAGAKIVTDTFGFAIGQTEKCKTPIAVCGRVLAYPFEKSYAFHAGDPVCSGPNGTVSRMTREEVMMYPERMIGTVVSTPHYKEWGPNRIPVKGRIWIQVR